MFDPFCGCATTCVAAQDLNRNWIGIDISEKAVELVLRRFKDELKILAPKIINRSEIPIRSDGVVRSKDIKHIRYGEQEGHFAGGKHFSPFHGLTIYYRVARSAGGTDDDSNIQLLCSSCNSIKGNRSMGYYCKNTPPPLDSQSNLLEKYPLPDNSEELARAMFQVADRKFKKS